MAVSAFGGKPSSFGGRVLRCVMHSVWSFQVFICFVFFTLFLRWNSTSVLFSVLHFSFLLIG